MAGRQKRNHRRQLRSRPANIPYTKKIQCVLQPIFATARKNPSTAITKIQGLPLAVSNQSPRPITKAIAAQAKTALKKFIGMRLSRFRKVSSFQQLF